MIYALLGSIATNLLLGLGFLRYAQTMQRPYTRREDVLIDKIMHLAGRTWTPPPSQEPVPLEQELDRYVSSPSDDLEDF